MKAARISAFQPGELTDVTDPSGHSLTYVKYDDVFFPPFPGIKPRLEALPQLPARDDDVLIMGYPKSGTHWTWEIIHMLTKRKAEDSGREKIEQFFELIDAGNLANERSPRILNSHIRPSLYPEDCVKRKCKIVFVMRNPRDAYVSFYNHTKNIRAYDYDGLWSDYFELAMQGNIETGSWFDYVDAWDKFYKDHPEIPVLTLYYEESKQDLLSTVKKLASFLGMDVEESVCKEIAEACTFDKQKAAKVKAYPKHMLDMWDNKDYKMYRKGVSGDWKNWFTVAQHERFNAVYRERMKNSKYFQRYMDEISAFQPGELTDVTDPSGHILTYVKYDDVFFPPFPGIKPRLPALPQLPGRDDDVLIMGYPKSGTHWTWEIIHMLTKRKAEDSGREKIEQFLEKIDAKNLANERSPRILNSHIRPSLYPEDCIKRKCKIVFVMRNPRDAYVSFYNHTKNIRAYDYGGLWSDYFELAMQGNIETGSWFGYVDAWDKFYKDHPELPVLTLYYEESKQDLLSTVKKLASFLGLDVEESVCKEIAEACTFDKQKAAKVKAYPKHLLDMWDNKDYKMYRKGVSGDWKNWFTVAQNERFNAVYRERMKNSKYFQRYMDE